MGNLFNGDVDAGNSATADPTVDNEPPPGEGICEVTLLQWTCEPGLNTLSPFASTANATASAKPGEGVDSTESTSGTRSRGSDGEIPAGITLNTANEEYFELAIETASYTTVFLAFGAAWGVAVNSATGVAVHFRTASPLNLF